MESFSYVYTVYCIYIFSPLHYALVLIVGDVMHLKCSKVPGVLNFHTKITGDKTVYR